MDIYTKMAYLKGMLEGMDLQEQQFSAAFGKKRKNCLQQ